MKNTDSIDDIFKSKLEESTLGYSESYWLEAKKGLGLEKKRRYLGWWLSAAALLVVVFTAGIYFYSDKNVKNAGADNASVGVAQIESPAEVNSNTNTGAGTKDAAEVVQEERQSTENRISKVASPVVIEKKDKGIKAEGMKADNIVSVQKPIKSVEKTTPIQELNKTEQLIISDAKKSENVKEDNIVIENVSEATIEKKADEPLILNNDSLASVPEVRAEALAEKHPVTKGDFIRTQFLSLKGGVVLNKGVSAGDNSLVIGALPYGGVSYTRSVSRDNKKLIEAGVLLTSFGKVQQEKEIHHSNYYSFGYGEPGETIAGNPKPITDTVFTLKSNSVFVLQVPVNFIYNINNRHSINVGAGASILISTLSDVTDFDASSRKVWGYNDGFNAVGGFVQLGYSLKFCNNWAAQINLQQAVTNMLDDSFFQSGKKYHSSNVQLGLAYNFSINNKKDRYAKK